MTNYATILPPHAILAVAVTQTELPAFFRADDRPSYVPETIQAIFHSHLRSKDGFFYHMVVINYVTNASELLARIAADHAAAIEAEAHDLERIDEIEEAHQVAGIF